MKVGRLEILNWIVAVGLTGLAACGGDPHQRGAQTEPVPTATQEFVDDSKVTAEMPASQNTPLENNSARSDTFEAVASARTITVEKVGPTPPLVDRLFDEIEQDEKRNPPLVGSASPVSVSFPTEITTTDGNTYGAVKLSRVEPDGIVISYTVEGGGIGLSKIKYQRLPESLRTRLGFDPQSAADFEKQQAQGQVALGMRLWSEKEEESRKIAVQLATEEAEAMAISRRAQIARQEQEALRQERERVIEEHKYRSEMAEQMRRQTELLQRAERVRLNNPANNEWYANPYNPDSTYWSRARR